MDDTRAVLKLAKENAHSKKNWRSRLRAFYNRSDAFKGYTLLSPTLLVMLFSMCVPFGLMVVMSFWTQSGYEFDTDFTLLNYEKITSTPVYSQLLMRSLWISAACTLATVLIAYPMAYYVAFHVHRRKMMWIILMTLPFWTSYLLRIFSWKVILGFNGVINSGLMGMGIIDKPLEFLLYNPTAVVITLTHAWVAFAILPIYISLEKIDKSLLEAATDLGDGPIARFFRVTLPLSLPGVIAATILIFVPTVGDYVTPAMVGGPNGLMIANLITAHFGIINNWPGGSALAIIMMLVVGFIAAIYIGLTRFAVKNIE
ncbi:MAG: spermidine/putrescine transport system permease protein [Candidatus Azotimanducaceae bacterium]|jgi:spermidine/putrescine transport system permease protein